MNIAIPVAWMLLAILGVVLLRGPEAVTRQQRAMTAVLWTLWSMCFLLASITTAIHFFL